ncbi:peptidoglycan-associated lipoprotein Pal [Ectothiorhodospiraceae bacterium 2226]|nr:peptidoglycan-associated lipoprotein Pal [Ectothiorhodospiraceae bacterium 2226]
MSKYVKLLPAVLVVSLAGCASVLDGPPRDTADGAEGAREAAAEMAETDARRDRDAQLRGAELESGFQGHPLDDPQSLLSERVIYFAFDSSELSEEQRAVLNAHARFLGDHPEVQVVLEGHTDERGSREYNLALGERRAKSVLQYLNLQGVNGAQLDAISFGEERPAVQGSDESAWQYNRRVEILYSGY